MKWWGSILLMIIANVSFGQESIDFSQIDERVQSIQAAPPDTLAKQLTANYTTDLQKVRSIFKWIAEHIAYRVRVSPHSSNSYSKIAFHSETDDTSSVLKPLNERVAEGVLENGVAVCDGYARLFKTLCDYAGIRSEIITGYAKTNSNRAGAKFRANHTWNAVYIDSAWKLLDVTWASGYVSFSNDYVKNFDEFYFLTPPRSFIRDHYPEDPQWTLLSADFTIEEFKHTPFKYSGFAKYPIHSFTPSNGIIEASVGDTISVELETDDVTKDLVVSDSLFFDSTLFVQVGRKDSVQQLCKVVGKKITCSYIVASASVEWLYIIYNKEVIMRYKIAMKKNYTAAK